MSYIVQNYTIQKIIFKITWRYPLINLVNIMIPFYYETVFFFFDIINTGKINWSSSITYNEWNV